MQCAMFPLVWCNLDVDNGGDAISLLLLSGSYRYDYFEVFVCYDFLCVPLWIPAKYGMQSPAYILHLKILRGIISTFWASKISDSVLGRMDSSLPVILFILGTFFGC